MNRNSVENRFFGIARIVSIVVLVVVTGFPLVYMIGLSFKPISSLLQNPVNPFPLPHEISFTSYARVLLPVEQGGAGFLSFLANSTIVAVTTVALVLVLATLGAYAAARLRFRGRGAVNGAIILVYLLPAILLAVPLFIFFSRLGLRPSLGAVVITYVALTLPLGIFILRNYLESIPAELDEAARIDGANRFQIVRLVTAPLALPALAAVGIYVFISAWDEFLFALLLLVDKRQLWTVTLGISQLSDLNGSPETVLMAGCVVVTIPVLVAFVFAQRFLVDGLAAGGVKE